MQDQAGRARKGLHRGLHRRLHRGLHRGLGRPRPASPAVRRGRALRGPRKKKEPAGPPSGVLLLLPRPFPRGSGGRRPRGGCQDSASSPPRGLTCTNPRPDAEACQGFAQGLAQGFAQGLGTRMRRRPASLFLRPEPAARVTQRRHRVTSPERERRRQARVRQRGAQYRLSDRFVFPTRAPAAYHVLPHSGQTKRGHG
jgi:hypothetical protein